MLAYHRRPVCLSFISTDLPILSTVETAATLYQKGKEQFHLLLHQSRVSVDKSETSNEDRLLWLEISPYRVIMTVQANGKSGYRHFWEQGIYGMSRYWLHSYSEQESSCFLLSNYTRSLKLEGYHLPQRLRVEYELWSEKVQLGHYIFHLEIHD